MSLDDCSKKAETNPDKTMSVLKLYAQGKLGVLFCGDNKYIKEAEESFSKAVNVWPQFDDVTFVEEMRKQDVPDEAIKEFMDSFDWNDDVWLSTKSYF